MSATHVTYLLENETIGWFALEVDNSRLTDKQVISRAIDTVGSLDGQTIVIDKVSDNELFYDEIVESWGVDVY